MAPKCRYPRTTIAVDGVPWDVSSEPVRTKWRLDKFPTTRINRSDDAYAMATAPEVIVFGCFVVGIGVLILSMTAKLFWDGDFVVSDDLHFLAFAVVLCVVAIAWSVPFMTRSIRFDRSTGTMTTRAWFRTWSEVPLKEIVAVQCLYSEEVSTKNLTWDILQLNLVVIAGSVSRLYLTSSTDEKWLRETASELASFLEVPVVDQIAASKAAYEANRFKLWW